MITTHSNFLYPKHLAKIYPRIARYNEDAGLWFCEQSGGTVAFSDEGARKIVDRFRQLVLQRPLHPRVDEQVYDQVESEIGQKLGHAYRRFAGIHRLPNALLFGVDTLGPDLSQAFAGLIAEPLIREEILKKARRDIETFKRSGRNVSASDKAGITQLTGHEDFGVHMDMPDPSGESICLQLLNGGFYYAKDPGDNINFTMYQFYDPSSIQPLGAALYHAPDSTTLIGILLGFTKNFRLN